MHIVPHCVPYQNVFLSCHVVRVNIMLVPCHVPPDPLIMCTHIHLIFFLLQFCGGINLYFLFFIQVHFLLDKMARERRRVREPKVYDMGQLEFWLFQDIHNGNLLINWYALKTTNTNSIPGSCSLWLDKILIWIPETTNKSLFATRWGHVRCCS